LISQVAHITCKKNNYEILSNTVAEKLSAGYEKLHSSALVFLKPPSAKSKVKAVFISKNAFNVMLADNAEDQRKCNLTYSVYSGEENTFSMQHVGEEKFEKGSEIICTIPSFKILLAGDLAFYADVLGMPNLSSYWCPWCLNDQAQW